MEWRPVVGFEGYYEVSDTGLIRSIDRYIEHRGRMKWIPGRLMSLQKSKRGYYLVQLSKNGSIKDMKVYRAVADAFIPNPDNKPEVDHIDGDKSNNNASNLRWVTHLENIRYAEQNGLREPIHRASKQKMLDPSYKERVTEPMYRARRKKTYCYSLDGELIGEYESITDAAKANNCSNSAISICCAGKRNSVFGKKYSFEKTSEE